MIRCTLLHDLRDWLYPDACGLCQKSLDWGQSPLCLPCEAKLPYGLQRFGKENALYRRLQGRTSLLAAGYFLEFRRESAGAELLHNIKYDTHLKLLSYLIQQWVRELKREQIWEQATLIPVPPNRLQSRKRGYHAASVMADELSHRLGMPVCHNVLNRSFLTRSQTRLNRGDRWSNLHNVYSVNPRQVPAGAMILVDDVVTTGATVERCLNLLQMHSNAPLALLSLAYTL